MSNFNIGLSGLNAAQKALDTIGNNIANAATPGYHRQKIELSPSYSIQQGTFLIGGGVDVNGVKRTIDNLLEQEMYRQQSTLGQISQEFVTLQAIENALGELSTEDGGLNASMDRFFSSLQNLSANPTEIIWQNQVVSDAEAMAGQFRTTGDFLNSLESQITLETENAVSSINSITSQIAELNKQIGEMEITGRASNSMSDQRDQLISKLSELVDIQTISRKYGVVDVSAGGLSLVSSSTANRIEAGLDNDGKLGISIEGAFVYNTTVQGGKVGGLLSLKNDIVSNIHNDLDSLANSVIQQINQYHVQGVGSQGSFTSLTGKTNASGNLADFASISDGSLFIRVKNTVTGEITRTEIPIDAASDSLSDVATSISAVTGLTASVNSSNQLTVSADANYEFDFLPAVLSEPTTTSFGQASPPTITVSGIYTGSDNQDFTFTVKGDGSVGNGSLQLEVRDGANQLISTVNVGSGYAAGDKINIGNTGIEIALSTGDLDETTHNDNFTIQALASSDTSGILAAVGINTFFSGTSAMNMAVNSDISSNPRRIATAIGPEMTDNTNIARMADVKNQALTRLNEVTCGDFYRRMVTDVGQQLSVKQMRHDNVEVMLLNLSNQQNDVSGVNINDEAAQMLIFEQMFQAMSKYISTLNESMSSLMELL